MRQAPLARGCRLKPVNFAASQQGQNFFDFLVYIGKSPKEFGRLEWDEQDFYLAAWNRKNTKEDESEISLLEAQRKLREVKK